MLMVAGFPSLVIVFFGIFAFFLWKIFSSGSRNETREIFEFYLSANEMLRDDDRRWYGFEMQETISRGEHILQTVNGAPPLVYFTLGALYNKIGDHKAAVRNLEYVLENQGADEAAYTQPSPELRNYVRILRKIEREPAEAPLTSAAVRALERSRKNRGRSLLEDSRQQIEEANRRAEEKVFDKGLPAGTSITDQPAAENVNGRPNGNANRGDRPLLDRMQKAAERKEKKKTPRRNGMRTPSPTVSRSRKCCTIFTIRTFSKSGKSRSLGSRESHSILDFRFWILDFVWLAIYNHEPRTTNHEPRTTNHEPRTTNHEPRTTNHEPRTTNHEPRTTNHDHFNPKKFLIEPTTPFRFSSSNSSVPASSAFKSSLRSSIISTIDLTRSGLV